MIRPRLLASTVLGYSAAVCCGVLVDDDAWGARVYTAADTRQPTWLAFTPPLELMATEQMARA